MENVHLQWATHQTLTYMVGHATVFHSLTGLLDFYIFDTFMLFILKNDEHVASIIVFNLLGVILMVI